MLPLLRATLGLILIPHGCQKLFGWFGGMGFEKFAALFDKLGYKPGAFWVAVVALTEVVGGLMLVFGFCTRFAALAVAIFMINAVWFTSAKGFFWTNGGAEFSILLLVVVAGVPGARQRQPVDRREDGPGVLGASGPSSIPADQAGIRMALSMSLQASAQLAQASAHT